MSSNMYLYEKAREAHSQDLWREAEKAQLLSHLPRPRRKRSRYAKGSLGVLLLKLGARLKQFEQSDAEVEHSEDRTTRDQREETDALRYTCPRTPGPELV